MAARQRLEAKMAAAQLPPRLQTSAADRNVFVTTQHIATAHHLRDMQPSRARAAAEGKARAALRRAASSREGSPRRSTGARAEGAHASGRRRGHSSSLSPPTAREDALVAAAKDSSRALQRLAGELELTLSRAGDMELIGESADGEVAEVGSLSELVRTLKLHALRTREALERERDRRHSDVARLNAQLSIERDEHTRLRHELDARVEAAVQAERARAQEGVAAQIKRAVEAADGRAAEEIAHLHEQHARVQDGLRRQLARYERDSGFKDGLPRIDGPTNE
mmetsp:Transcript_4550/g.11727  ORF Transcript_4550/g.11727 Transcript_4550/m.11727 type:complete len:281 (+) Transcript_4550:49-891(+)